MYELITLLFLENLMGFKNMKRFESNEVIISLQIF